MTSILSSNLNEAVGLKTYLLTSECSINNCAALILNLIMYNHLILFKWPDETFYGTETEINIDLAPTFLQTLSSKCCEMEQKVIQ